MRKSMKKILTLVLSAAIAAAMITVPVITEAAERDSVVVEEGTFTLDDNGVAAANVKNNGDTLAIVSIISASYDESGKLVDVKYVPVTIQAGATKTVQTTALTDTGHEIKAFVWDMTNNQCKPVPIAEDETPPTWDIGLFTLIADKQYIDVKEGGEVTIKVSDIYDSDGYPVDYVPETAMKWSCTEDTLTVERGKLIIPAGFDIGDAETKDITVNCTIGDVTNGVTIVVHSYDVFETFDNITDSWGFTGTGGAIVEDGVLKLIPNSSEDDIVTDIKQIFDESITAAKKLHVMFDWQSLVEQGTKNHSNFELQDSDGNLLFLIRGVDGKGLYYSYSTADDNGYRRFKNDYGNIRNVNKKCSVDLIIDFTYDPPKSDGLIKGEDIGFSFEAPMNYAANLGRLCAYNTSGSAPMVIDNFRIKVLE